MRFFSTLFFSLFSAAVAFAQTAQTDTFRTSNGKEVIFTAIKHASFRIQFDGLEFQIDPVGKMQPETDYTQFPKADYIFVTHEHGDHCDKAVVDLLKKPKTIVITNENSSHILQYGQVMRNGDFVELSPEIKVEAVPAYNTTPGREQYHPKGRDNGFILSLDGLRIYIAGDTEDIPEMEDIKDIDIAFLPTNQPYTMTPEQTARAARLIRPKVLFPYHYSATPITRVAELLEGTGIDVRIRNYQ